MNNFKSSLAYFGKRLVPYLGEYLGSKEHKEHINEEIQLGDKILIAGIGSTRAYLLSLIPIGLAFLPPLFVFGAIFYTSTTGIEMIFEYRAKQDLEKRVSTIQSKQD